MSKTNTLNQLKKISTLFTRDFPPAECRQSRLFMGGTLLALIGENTTKFEEAIQELLNSLPGVKGTLADSVLIDKVVMRIREKKDAGNDFTAEEAEAFEREILGMPLQKFRVVRQIFGVTLPPNAESQSLGDFVIGFGRQLLTYMHDGPIVTQFLKPEDLELLYVQCTTEARDPSRALELADVLFYRFELLFRLFIGRRTLRLEVGILNYIGPQSRARLFGTP